MPLVYKDSTKFFKIDQSMLPKESRKISIINALYIALFKEFAGAVKSDKYKHLTNQQKMEQINIFAEAWLKERHYL